MLKGLARWLCTAGYDVAMEPNGTPDRRLIERALAEKRILLSRDRHLLEIRQAAEVVVLLEGHNLESLAAELNHKLDVDWLYRPFSRCLLCNMLLLEGESAAEDPPDVAQVFFCPQCRRRYWHGGHVRRMRHRLEHWQTLR